MIGYNNGCKHGELGFLLGEQDGDAYAKEEHQ